MTVYWQLVYFIGSSLIIVAACLKILLAIPPMCDSARPQTCLACGPRDQCSVVQLPATLQDQVGASFSDGISIMLLLLVTVVNGYRNNRQQVFTFCTKKCIRQQTLNSYHIHSKQSYMLIMTYSKLNITPDSFVVITYYPIFQITKEKTNSGGTKIT